MQEEIVICRAFFTEVRDNLVEKIEANIDYRERCAVRYPHDTRNSQSAHALGLLRENLLKVPLDHPALGEIAEIWQRATGGDSEDDELLGTLILIEGECISHYGFHCPENGDAGAFLNDLAASMRAEI